MASRNFHPWEGGEGKVTSQHVVCHGEVGKQLLKKGKHADAAKTFLQATVYPDHLGEGKLDGAQKNNIHYFLGCAYEGLQARELADLYLEKATVGLAEPTSAMFYNDQPPDMIFYQVLALVKLSQMDKARARFHKLIDYGEKHIFDTESE